MWLILTLGNTMDHRHEYEPIDTIETAAFRRVPTRDTIAIFADRDVV